ncbi:hypothetical protein CLU96_2374 [Chryseobacterium sp. 52]|nr:hypothetical protein CLU96_2374 [Chryseobacterium sp. 52]
MKWTTVEFCCRNDQGYFTSMKNGIDEIVPARNHHQKIYAEYIYLS